MGNVLGIIGTFLENYQGLFENGIIGKKISIIYLPLLVGGWGWGTNLHTHPEL